MSDSTNRTVYLNGQYLPLSDAHVSVMDRGFLFGDGVYEVIPVFYGQLFRPEQHLRRLQRSLEAVQIEISVNETEFLSIFEELLARNRIADQLHYSIYLQVTRGMSPQREHVFPEETKPTLFVQCTAFHPSNPEKLAQGGKVITAEDIRWQWCYIKAITLLPNVLFAQRAKQMGVDEVVWIRNGYALEGCSSNLFMVKDGVLKTPPINENMLGGITRELILELANENHLPVQQQAITLDELKTADEIWMTGSLKEILPIIQVDEDQIGTGQVGPVWRRMKDWYEGFKISFSKRELT